MLEDGSDHLSSHGVTFEQEANEPTAEEMLIELAKARSFGLQPQPIQNKNEQSQPVLVVLVGDPEQIEELLVDWLAEAAVYLGLRPEEIDRDVLYYPGPRPLGIPPFGIAAGLERRHHLSAQPTSQLAETICNGQRLRSFHQETFRHLEANLKGALFLAWERLDPDHRRTVTSNQCRDAVHQLRTSRLTLFGGPDPVVKGVIVLVWGEPRRIVTGYMSEVSRRLQACLTAAPGSTSLAQRWLERAALQRPGIRRLPVQKIEEPEEAPLPAPKRRRVRATPVPGLPTEHLARVESFHRRRGRPVTTLSEREVAIGWTPVLIDKQPIEKVPISHKSTAKRSRLPACYREFRVERRISRRHIVRQIAMAAAARRKAKRNNCWPRLSRNGLRTRDQNPRADHFSAGV